ncbi:MAG: indolepyruvate oxidoreductase subunit beta [candidate division WOR-3 bacterium]
MNIIVCGVGGQGVLLFSDLIGNIALAAGLDVKKSEVHGMAQRGGSVTTHVRYAPKVYSPLVEEGSADLVVAFEKLEALRHVHFLAGNGWLVYDPHRIDPLPVLLGLVERPTDALLDERIMARAPRRLVVSAFEAAREIGDPRVQNVVMLGAVSRLLEFPRSVFRDIIRLQVKPGFVDLNLRAFDRGLAIGSSYDIGAGASYMGRVTPQCPGQTGF